MMMMIKFKSKSDLKSWTKKMHLLIALALSLQAVWLVNEASEGEFGNKQSRNIEQRKKPRKRRELVLLCARCLAALLLGPPIPLWAFPRGWPERAWLGPLLFSACLTTLDDQFMTLPLLIPCTVTGDDFTALQGTICFSRLVASAACSTQSSCAMWCLFCSNPPFPGRISRTSTTIPLLLSGKSTDGVHFKKVYYFRVATLTGKCFISGVGGGLVGKRWTGEFSCWWQTDRLGQTHVRLHEMCAYLQRWLAVWADG